MLGITVRFGVLLVLLSGLVACHPYDPRIRQDQYRSATPPPHAPAYGARRHHSYRYYPDPGFYYDTTRRLYFYLDSRGSWAFSARLPDNLRVYLSRRSVGIQMESDRPYTRYRSHRKNYPPGLYKKNHKRHGKPKKNKGKGRGRQNRDDFNDDFNF